MVEAVVRASRGRLGRLLGHLEGSRSASWGILRGPVEDLGASWRPKSGPRGILACLGRLLGRLGGVLSASWCVLGASWAPLGPSWGRLGPSWAPWDPTFPARAHAHARMWEKRVLEASWAPLGASWGCLGRLLARLGAILGGPGASGAFELRRPRSRTPKPGTYLFF